MRYQPESLVLPGKNHGTEKSGSLILGLEICKNPHSPFSATRAVGGKQIENATSSPQGHDPLVNLNRTDFVVPAGVSVGAAFETTKICVAKNFQRLATQPTAIDAVIQDNTTCIAQESHIGDIRRRECG